MLSPIVKAPQVVIIKELVIGTRDSLQDGFCEAKNPVESKKEFFYQERSSFIKINKAQKKRKIYI